MQSTIFILACLFALCQCSEDLLISDDADIECILESGVDRQLTFNLSFQIEPPVPEAYYKYLKCMYEKKEFIVQNKLDAYYMSTNGQYLSSISPRLAEVINDCVTSSTDKSLMQMIFNFDSCVSMGVVKYYAETWKLDNGDLKCVSRVGISRELAKLPNTMLKSSVPKIVYKFWGCMYDRFGYFDAEGNLKYEEIKSILSKRLTTRAASLVVNSCRSDWADSNGRKAFEVDRCINLRIIKMFLHSKAVLHVFRSTVG